MTFFFAVWAGVGFAAAGVLGADRTAVRDGDPAVNSGSEVFSAVSVSTRVVLVSGAAAMGSAGAGESVGAMLAATGMVFTSTFFADEEY